MQALSLFLSTGLADLEKFALVNPPSLFTVLGVVDSLPAQRDGVADEPNFVPLSKRFSLSAHNSGICRSTSCATGRLNLDPAEDADAMPQILGSSVTYRIAVGPQQGRLNLHWNQASWIMSKLRIINQSLL